MAAYLPLFYDQQFLTNSGSLGATYLLYTYDSGTSTPKATYTDATGATANTNPITLNSAGRPSSAIFLGSGSYSFELKTSSGTLIKRWDGVTSAQAATDAVLAELASNDTVSVGAKLIGIDQLLDYAAPGTLAYMLRGARTLEGAGAWGDGTHDDTGYVLAAMAKGGTWIANRSYRVTSTVAITVDGTTILSTGGKITHETSTIEDAVYASELDRVLIVGLEVDGRKSLKSAIGVAEARGIHMDRCSRVTIRDCYVHDCYEHGIRIGLTGSSLGETSDVKIIGNRCEDNGNATNARGRGIWVFGMVYKAVISHNTCIDNEAGGIVIDDTSTGGGTGQECYDVDVSHNVITGAFGTTSTNCIGISGTQRLNVIGNICRGYRDALSLTAYQSGAYSGVAIVSNNYFEGTETCAKIYDHQELDFSNNKCYLLDTTNADAAVVIDSAFASAHGISDVHVTGNFIKTVRAGIEFGATPDHYDDLVNVTARRNVIRHTTTTPASGHTAIQCSHVSRGTISDNIFSSFYDGIVVSTDCANMIVDSNSGRLISNYGISVNVLGTLVLRNTLRDGTTADLRIGGTANDPSTYIRSNEFLSTTPSSGTLTSTIRKSNVGIADSLASQLTITDGVTAPSAVSGSAQIFVSSADGDLKVIFGDGTVKTIVTDT